MAAPPKSSQAVPVLAFPEHLFDELAASLRGLMADAARAHAHSRMSGRASTRLGRDVGLDVAGEHRVDEVFVEKPLSAPRVVGVNLSRRRARSSSARQPRFSDVTL
jgi:hypothetical protein